MKAVTEEKLVILLSNDPRPNEIELLKLSDKYSADQIQYVYDSFSAGECVPADCIRLMARAYSDHYGPLVGGGTIGLPVPFWNASGEVGAGIKFQEHDRLQVYSLVGQVGVGTGPMIIAGQAPFVGIKATVAPFRIVKNMSWGPYFQADYFPGVNIGTEYHDAPWTMVGGGVALVESDLNSSGTKAIGLGFLADVSGDRATSEFPLAYLLTYSVAFYTSSLREEKQQVQIRL